MYTEDDSVINSRTEVAGKFIIQKAFAYIKLYEQGTGTMPFVSNFMNPFYSGRTTYI